MSSYVTAGNPTMLTNCGDVYVLPHADPQDWTTASGYFSALRGFVAANGYLWAACHAVSALEGIPGGNFLSVDGLIPWTDHDKGTPPYAYTAAGAKDPIMQFMGTLDASTLNGSEQIFLPKSAGWRNTTTVAAYDPDQAGTGSGKPSPGPAAVLAYGHAFGDPKMGMVMIEGGHDLNSGTVASQDAKRTLDVFVTFANGSKNDPGKGIGTETNVADITNTGVAVDKTGIPLPGSGDGKCPTCDIGEEGRFIGPVIHLAVTGPVAYSMKIFGTFGEFVCDLNGRVTESDLPLLDNKTVRTAAGDRIQYLQRIVWSGRSNDGQRAGTGAYILNAELHYPADPAKNAPASSESFFRKFGHVR